MTIINAVTSLRDHTSLVPRLCINAALLALLLAQGARAQTTSATDGSTPSALAPGAPAGSYPLSGFESVNLYNGNLNFALPLLQNGGRGAVGAVVTLKVEQHWRAKRLKPPANCELTGTCEPTFFPDPNGWLGLDQDYGPGVLKGRSGGVACGDLALTRLTFTAGDGTEFELRDQLNEGRPLGFSCNPSQGALRGAVFVTADGTAATFISDAVIYDWTGGAPTTINPSGVLKLKDGTVYRIDAGKVSWTRDRHGNRVNYTYEGSRVKTITDSLGRVVTINYGVSDVAPYGLCDQIVYSGFGGAQRIVRVSYASLGSVLRTNRPGDAPSPRTLAQLFPDLQGSGTTVYNPPRKSAVWLPDDGVVRKAYKLFYNAYGELARVELPTGGAVEYDFGDYLQHGPTVIFRGIVERRVYPDGTNREGRTTYVGAAGVRTVEAYDASDVLLTRSQHYFNGRPQDSLGQRPTDYSKWQEGREYKTEVFDVAGGAASATPARRIEQTWRQRAPVSWWTGAADAAPSNDPRLVETVTTLEPGGANLVSKQSALNPQTGAVGFDQYNNQTDAWSYDFGVGAAPPYPVRHTHSDYLSSANGVDYTSTGGVHIRGLTSARQVYAVNPSDGTETLTAKGEARYDEAAYPLLSCDPDSAVTCASVPQWDDPGTGARGNPTTTRDWLDTTNTWVETHTQYDQLGHARKNWDARGNLSEVTYKDSFVGTNPGAYVANTFAFPTKAASAAAQPDPAAPFGAHQPLVTTTIYDFNTGLPSSTTDPNNRTTVFQYSGAGGAPDPLDRLRAVVRPDGSRTDYEYGDVAGNLYVRLLTDLDGARRVESKQFFDGLGRVYREATYENFVPTKTWITVDTEYDALGRVARASMPYRAAEGAARFSTDKWAETTYDSLGRVRKVTTRPDGAAVSTDYSGDRVLVKDQADKERVSRADALGRLTEVWEVTAAEGGAEASTVSLAPFPGHAEAAWGYLTSYRYDAVGRLRMVEQAGQHLGQLVTQRRFFAYDSLGRLVRARYPEQGLITNPSNDPDFPALTDPVTQNSQWSLAYRYDNNGNVLARMDARLVGQSGSQSNLKVRYSYDALDRNITTDYSDTPLDPDVTRYYDGAAAGLGLPWKSESARSALTTVEQYDSAGRPKRQKQQFWVAGQWGQAYTTLLDYNLAGDLKSLVYPSGHRVEYQYEAAGRLGDNGAQPAFKGTLGDGVERTYASQVVYDELGGMNQERFGTAQPVYNKHFYNSRGQLSQIRVSTYAFTDAPNREDWNRGALINHFSEQSWAGSGTDNNGNLRKQDMYVPNDDSITGFALSTFFYEYDALNRLTRAREGRDGADQWAQAYVYDRWGNRTVNANGTWGMSAPQFSVDAGTNRLGVPAGQAGQMAYDPAGNLTLDTYQGGQGGGGTRSYDAENRMTAAQFLSGQTQTASYVYDADGRRVKRLVGTSAEVWQVYGLGGELLAEYTPGAAPASPLKEYGYRGGELLVTAAPAGGGQAGGQAAPANAAADFSAGQNPSGVWSYGYRAAGGTFTPYASNSNVFGAGTSSWSQPSIFSCCPSVTHDDTGATLTYQNHPNVVQPADTLNLHPGPGGERSVVRWTAPAAGTYTVAGRFQGIDVSAGTTTDVSVTKGAATLFSGQVNGGGATAPFSLTVSAAAGEVVEFSVGVGSNGTYNSDSTGLAVTVTPANSASAVGDFSAAQNPAGAWAYGYRPAGGSFNAFTSNADVFGAGTDSWSQPSISWCCPFVTRNTTGATLTYQNSPNVVQPADVLNLHPGPNGERAVVKWTAPAAGTYAVAGRFEGIDAGAGTTTDVAVAKGATTLFGGQVNGYGSQAPFSLTVSVAAGEAIEFSVGVGANGSYNSDSTGLAATVTPRGSSTSGADVRWLVSDQLGTPRMVVDRTGSLAGVTRHDYLPFGEALPGDASFRTLARGYGSDGVRQQFTGYERDAEISLDYAQARYYSGVQGRFTSPDPLLASGRAARPQSWNRYAYVLNNPLRLIDPSGLLDRPTEAQQQPQPQQQQQQSPPPPASVTITTDVQFYSYPNDKPDDPAARTNVSPEANAVLNTATSQMASNIYNAIVAANAIDENPTTSQQVGIGLSLQVGSNGASGQVSGSTTVTVQTTGQVLQETQRANDVIQTQLEQQLSTMVSPVNGRPEGARLDSMPAANAPTIASSFALTARDKANQVARDKYQQVFPNRQLPKDFQYYVFPRGTYRQF